MTAAKTELLDQAGVVVSAVCACHCLGLPLALGILAAHGAANVAAPGGEWAVLGTSAILGLASLAPAYRRRHARKRCLCMFGCGIAAIAAAHTFLEGIPGAEAGAVCAGAALICSAHIVNRMLCKRCRACKPGQLLDEPNPSTVFCRPGPRGKA